ncbi:extradiol ring-cleavage dioxygenase [Sulfolobus acidocaldarius SUSAZ]|nr:extradiol ring-cleavage dioxygenase [Sulfolobus acidocaldarius SUSAZ]
MNGVGYFISHGSPMILVEENPWKGHLADLGKEIKSKYDPETVIISSPHFFSWGENNYTVISKDLKCIQDYFGFPKELYEFCYQAENDVELASELIKESNGMLKVEENWGLDHGAWIPLYYMFPEDKPRVVPISISSVSPRKHYELGSVIRKVSEKLGRRTLFIATGSPTHRLDLLYFNLKPRATKFDVLLIKLINEGKFEDILDMDSKYPKEYSSATPEGDLKTLHTLLGFVRPTKAKVLGYDIPWAGVSMLSALFEE